MTRPGYAPLPRGFMLRPKVRELDASALRLFLGLICRTGSHNDHTTSATIAELADECGVCRAAAYRHLKTLEANGWFRATAGARGVYTFVALEPHHQDPATYRRARKSRHSQSIEENGLPAKVRKSSAGQSTEETPASTEETPASTEETPASTEETPASTEETNSTEKPNRAASLDTPNNRIRDNRIREKVADAKRTGAPARAKSPKPEKPKLTQEAVAWLHDLRRDIVATDPKSRLASDETWRRALHNAAWAGEIRSYVAEGHEVAELERLRLWLYSSAGSDFWRRRVHTAADFIRHADSIRGDMQRPRTSASRGHIGVYRSSEHVHDGSGDIWSGDEEETAT